MTQVIFGFLIQMEMCLKINFAIFVGNKTAVNELTERLRADNYTIESEPRTTGDGYYESVALDPEDNYIEITS